MKTLAFAWRYLWSRPLGAALNVLLLSLGLASITFLLLVGHQLSRAFERDLAGIDVVVGAKGSPMQLILSGVLHIDVPPGNVPLQAVRALEQHPLVASVIPISLGDSFQSFRIVGTSHSYIQHPWPGGRRPCPRRQPLHSGWHPEDQRQRAGPADLDRFGFRVESARGPHRSRRRRPQGPGSGA